MPAFYLPAITGLSALMIVVLVGIGIGITHVSGFFAFVFVAFLAVVVWFWYRALFRRAYRLDLELSQIRWRAPLKGGELSVGDLTAVRPSRMTGGIWVLEVRNAPNVPVHVRKGFLQFVQELQVLRPDLPVNPEDLTVRISESLPGPSGFSKDHD